MSALISGTAPAGVDVGALNAAMADLSAPAVIYASGGCIPEGIVLTSSGRHATTDPVVLDEHSAVRIASITKTFTAATILRLWEQELINLDAPITELASTRLTDPLVQAGYDVDAITVRHLLSHTSGIYDHASNPRYAQMWFEQPDHHWTREEQIALSVGWSGPLHPPGTRFAYSDTGYVILGDIIENVTHRPLHEAVREQLRFSTLDLQDTWWEVAEPAPQGHRGKAVQTLHGKPTDHLHGSLDTYGGGGLIMSARDLTTFFRALFEDRVFDHPRTLSEMTRSLPHEGGDHYRLGIMNYAPQGDWRSQAFFHSGFWGTVAYYVPAKRLAVSAITSDQSAYADLNSIAQDLISQITCEW